MGHPLSTVWIATGVREVRGIVAVLVWMPTDFTQQDVITRVLHCYPVAALCRFVHFFVWATGKIGKVHGHILPLDSVNAQC